jgi:hypothetical protein
MGETVYVLCAVTSLICATLLVRAWRANRTELLLWSSVCFVGLFLNNVVLVIDELVTGTATNLLLLRDVTGFASILALVIGLVWKAR